MLDELRLGPFRIVHGSPRRVQHQLNNVPDATTALCRVTIVDLHHGSPRTLFCQTQRCQFKTATLGDEDSNGNPHKIYDIAMHRPFTIPGENLMVRKSDGSLDYSPFYQVQLEFEAGDDFSPWPPMSVDEFGAAVEDVKALSQRARHIILSSRSHSIKDSLNASLQLSLGTPSNARSIQTECRMECGFDLVVSGKVQSANTTESMMTSDVHINGNQNSSGVIFRSLSQRTWHRSAEAEQEPRTPVSTQLNESQSPDESNSWMDNPNSQESPQTQFGEVLYVLSAKQRIQLDSFRCIGCGEGHQSEQQLQTHFQQAHPDYHCIPAQDKGAVCFQVRPWDNADSSQTQQTFYIPSAEQQRLRNAPTEGSKVVVIANSTSKISPEPAYYPESEASHHTTQHAPSIFDDGDPEYMQMDSVGDFATTNVSEMHTLTAECDYDGQAPHSHCDHHGAFKTRSQKARNEDSRAGLDVFLVPKMKQPLYHPVSKALLKPGDPLPSPDANDDWVIEQHRGNIAEYTDVTMEEKDYIWRWDKFILRKNITASVYLAPAWLEFVRYNAAWLVSSQSRMAQFGNHTAVLLAQDTLRAEMIEAAKRYLQEARRVGPPITPDRPLPDYLRTRKSASGCAICRLPVRGPKTLLCHNKKCTQRLYHSDCAAITAKASVKTIRWKCNDCQDEI